MRKERELTVYDFFTHSDNDKRIDKHINFGIEHPKTTKIVPVKVFFNQWRLSEKMFVKTHRKYPYAMKCQLEIDNPEYFFNKKHRGFYLGED
jgi:hypothetical protein